METQLLKFLKVFQWLLRTLSLYRPATRLVRSHLGVWSVKGWDDVLKCTVVFISHGCLSHTQIGRRGTKQKPHICFLFHWCVCVCAVLWKLPFTLHHSRKLWCQCMQYKQKRYVARCMFIKFRDNITEHSPSRHRWDWTWDERARPCDHRARNSWLVMSWAFMMSPC